MSKQQQLPIQPLRRSATQYAPQNYGWLRALKRWASSSAGVCRQMGLLAILLAILTSCSDDKAGSQSADESINQTTADTEAEATLPTEQTSADNADTSAEQVQRGGSRYRVTAETAYFFDEPEQGTPSGNYLLRGDVIYGEQESNGFVKTRFKNPNGATVIGWLKTQELNKLAASTAPVAARTSQPSPTATPPQSAPAPDENAYENQQAASAPAEAAGASSEASATAVVQVARSYFYNSPDLMQPRKAHCVRGDKVRLGESSGDAVFVTFTNWEKVTTTGWMRKDALQ